jgi:hypothetical protein
MLNPRIFKNWLLVAAICVLTAMANAPKARAYGTYTAYSVGVAFWTPVWPTNWNWNPHYGAFFSGSNGLSYSFQCGAGPATPNWWGNTLNVALLEKNWYLTTASSQYSSCHQAFMQY